MADGIRRVRTEEVDWKNALPLFRLFGAFRLAIHPPKLLIALMLVVLLYVSGQILDAIWGPQAYSNEVQNYISMPVDAFEYWLNPQTREKEIEAQLSTTVPELSYPLKTQDESQDRFRRAYEKIDADYGIQRQRAMENPELKRDPVALNNQLEALRLTRQGQLEAVRAIEPKGVFNSGLWYEVRSFERLVIAATSLNFGFGELLRGLPHDRTTVVGSLREMAIYVPGWLLRAHPTFLGGFCTVGLAIWSLFGGALARMNALHATRNIRLSPTQSLRFAARRFHWLFLSYLVPAVVGVSMIGLLWLFGFVFFGLPYLHVVGDVFGGLLFFVALLIGLAFTLLLIGLLGTGNLLFPAVAVDDADAFDANSRAMSYIATRPWHLLLYTVVGLIYFGVTYLFVVIVVFFALSVTQYFVGAGAGMFMPGSRFEAMLPAPELGQLAYSVDWAELNMNATLAGSAGRVAASIILVWVHLFIALVAAYAVSFYFSAHTLIYLLMRKGVDETEFDEIAAYLTKSFPIK